jgi:segregation and condensation protein B
VSKRKKSSGAPAAPRDQEHAIPDDGSVTTRAVIPPDLLKKAMGESQSDLGDEARGEDDARARGDETSEIEAMPESAGVPVDAEGFEGESDGDEEVEAASDGRQAARREVAVEPFDAEMTVNLVGELPLPGRDDLDEPTVSSAGEALATVDSVMLQRKHLRGLLEALVFASDSPITPKELGKLASAPQKQVKELLAELQVDYATRGMHLDEVAGGWVFRTSPQYAPFVRDLTKQKPVRLTRAQVETLAIIAYRQPITRPEVDDVRGVDSGPVLKLLLERDLVRILGKRDEPGRPLIYGTTGHFLEFFGLKSLKDLPTLREFTELSDESREAFEDELGETPEDAARGAAEAEVAEAGREGGEHGDGEGDDADAGEGDDGGDEGDAESDEREVHESMRVPVGAASSAHDLSDEGELADEAESADEADLADDSEADDDGAPAHAADDDGPTLTSEAPPKRADEDE